MAVSVLLNISVTNTAQMPVYNPRQQQSPGPVFISVCLCVFPHDTSKTDAVRIIKLDKQVWHDESWKPIYFGVKRSWIKVTSHKHVAGVVLKVLKFVVISLFWCCVIIDWSDQLSTKIINRFTRVLSNRRYCKYTVARLSVYRPLRLLPSCLKVLKLTEKLFWKPIYFGVKRSWIKVTSHKHVAGVGLCTLMSAGFFYR